MIGEPVEEWEMPATGQPAFRIADSDEFETGRPGLQWQWQANPDEAFLHGNGKWEPLSWPVWPTRRGRIFCGMLPM